METVGTFLFWWLPGLILLLEAAVTILLSRRRLRSRLVWVIGSYLVLVTLAPSVHFMGPDEFGYGMVPALLITAPWYFIPGLHGANVLGCMLIGVLLNCMLFVILARVSYPKDTDRILLPPPDQETHVTS